MQDHLAICVKNVVKSHGSTQILNEMCLNVQRGTIYGLLGASGCGKTTILNCIVGRSKVDRGEVWILGEECKGVPGNRVGYMPQNMALINEITVKDSIYLFGRIFGMDKKRLRKKYQELRTLLDLPSDDRFVANCSGGEQRRISFAIALVHSPELLILDEPCVGADPILRDRMWNYLVETCRRDNTTVLLTTHYIEESRQADKIGFMRGGKLLVEDSPTALLSAFELASLEDVFLLLSRSQDGEINHVNATELINSNRNITAGNSMENLEMELGSTVKITGDRPRKQINSLFVMHRFIALLIKNWKKIRSNKIAVIIQILIPTLQIVLFLTLVGRDVHDIPLGIINDETIPEFCSKIPLNETVVPVRQWDCELNSISCRLMHYLEDPMIKKTYNYDSVSDAIKDVERGHLVGVLHIERNLSSMMQRRVVDGISPTDDVLDTEIQVWMDMSYPHIGSSVKQKLYDLYQKFHESVYSDCGFSAGTIKMPIRTEEYFGNRDDEFIIFMTPGLLLITIYSMGVLVACVIIVDEKLEGIWDRSMVAGVTTLEMVLSHFVVQAVILLIMTLELIVLVFVIVRQDYAGSLFLIFAIVYFQGISGIVLGFIISVIGNSHFEVNSFIFLIFNCQFIFCGVFWPIESMLQYVNIFSRCLPLTFPIESLRNVVKKGWGLSDGNVLTGVSVMLFWIVFPALLGMYVIRHKR